MKKNTKNILSFFTMLLFIFFAIASVASKKNMTVEKGQIPPGINGYKGTLVILKHSKSWNHYAEKYFEENYQGKYIFIDKSELSKYSDKNEYRFVLDRGLETETDMSNGFSTTAAESLCVIDEQTGKRYCTVYSSTYGKLLKYYSAALEEERTK